MRDAIGAGMKEMASTLSQVAIGEVRESEKIDGGSSAPIAPSDFASTLVMSLRVEDQCAIAWIGDSRAYLFRDGLLALLTQDHSVARIEYGERHPDRADLDPDGRVLVRACMLDVPLDPNRSDILGGRRSAAVVFRRTQRGRAVARLSRNTDQSGASQWRERVVVTCLPRQSRLDEYARQHFHCCLRVRFGHQPAV